MARDKILVVGGNSKIAKLFIDSYAKDYAIYITTKRPPNIHPETVVNAFHLDLSDIRSVSAFINEVKDIDFKAVLFLASTFASDQTRQADFSRQFSMDQQINVISPIIIAKALKFSNHDGRVVMFGDMYAHKLNPRMISYSYSKQLLESATRVLSQDLGSSAKVFCLKLGIIIDLKDIFPTNYNEYNNLPKSAKNLINFLNYLIRSEGLSSYDSVIEFGNGDQFKLEA